MKFRKKPIVIEAVQWKGWNYCEVESFMCFSGYHWSSVSADANLVIHAREGDHTAIVGDWIIRGVKGDFYLCKHDIFEATHAPADDIANDGLEETGNEQAMIKQEQMVRHWRSLANCCDQELKRDANPNSGYVMAPDERIRYEQSARIYRKCADELANTAVSCGEHPRSDGESAPCCSDNLLFSRLASIKRPPPWASSRGFEWVEKLMDDDLKELAELIDRFSSGG